MIKLLVLVLIISMNCWALPPYTNTINTGVTNLSDTYDTSYPQQTLTGLLYVQRFSLVNETSTAVCCDTTNPSTAVAPVSVGNIHELCVPPGTLMNWDIVNIQSNVYCRGEAPIITGKIRVQTW